MAKDQGTHLAAAVGVNLLNQVGVAAKGPVALGEVRRAPEVDQLGEAQLPVPVQIKLLENLPHHGIADRERHWV